MLNRREFMLASAAAPMVQTPASSRPNFIILYTDDHGYHDLGCQGAGELKTPNLDALAASGARFTDWYSCAPVCAPSRAALMTGRYPIRAGVPSNGLALRPTERTIAALLKEQGYATAITGKWHLGSTSDTAPNAHGFDYFFGFHAGCIDFYSHRYYWGEPKTVNFHDLWRDRAEVFENGRYMTEMITEEAVRFIRASRARPFFLYCPFNAVHYPMHAPKKYVDRFPGLEPDRQMYAAMLAAADDGVGEIVATLEKLGLRQNTFIFFAGDNGATRELRAGLNQQPPRGGSNHPLRGFKFSLFDGGMREPAIMSWPARIPPRQVISEVGATMDVLPTFCAAAGISAPSDRTIDGRNVLPMVSEKARSPHETVFWDSGGQQAARRGNWKLVLNGMDADGSATSRERLKGEDAVFLSDLEADIGEKNNLRRRHPRVAEELTEAIQKWREEVSKA
jgi:arylsulfatase A-like enzyme